MKKILLATVLTLVMLSPAWAADVRFPAGPLLAASEQGDRRNGQAVHGDRDKKHPETIVIKGKGGKVTGVEREPERRPRKKK